ncbi:hypothetical protein DW322_21630 (plasmid) [Rhodococcus rhodnii]|uniref:DUF6968 domain-containing protein n=2 Tax=Rhodococcus rhodnii TaxID=38312 RepID=R7WGS4_9NOCA|nr:hypothetical protein [Rhodococcus rhodnii]EOM74212.1 hypothetical protein Rrhod_4477 [Rhodococcus rhodnii LMG 5362]TXG88238.1 hypothetical protein DW322_21630 [Rhodococcus rhodnii]
MDELPTFIADDIVMARTFDSPNGQVVLEVNTPRPFDAAAPEGDYCCTFRISGNMDAPYDGFGGGVDAVQALLLALAMAHEELRQTSPELTFLGETNLGLPVLNIKPDNAIEAVVSFPAP